MKRATIVLLWLSTVVLVLPLRGDAQSDGKAVFVTNCQSCHTVRVEGITEGQAVRKALNIDWTRLCRECTPDLSDVGQRRKADWLKAYLKNDKKGRNGLKHNELPITQDGKPLIVKGAGSSLPLGGTLSDEEIGSVVQWLTTLKNAPPQVAPNVMPDRPADAPSKPNPTSLSAPEAADLLQTAKSVAIVGKTGQQMMNRAMWNPNGERARQKVEAVMAAWGRYAVAPRLEDADLVIVVTEYQKNLSLLRRANLVADMKVFRGGQEPTADTPTVWAGDASEGLSQPATKVAEKFRDFVKGLPPRDP